MTREEKMNKRREANGGVCKYTYKPNPFPKDSKDYWKEVNARAKKNKNHKLPLAYLTSFFAKVDNELAKKKQDEKLLRSNLK